MTKSEKQERQSLFYVNEFGRDITARIDEGTTKLFTERRKAHEYANKIRSYVFEVFSNNTLVGFGVAK